MSVSCAQTTCDPTSFTQGSETRAGGVPAVMLQWKGETFTDILGVADFLAPGGPSGAFAPVGGAFAPEDRSPSPRRAAPGTRMPRE